MVNDKSTSEWKGGGNRFLIWERVALARNIGHVSYVGFTYATTLRMWQSVVAKGKLAGNAYKCILFSSE